MNWFDTTFCIAFVVCVCIAGNGSHPDPWGDLYTFLMSALGILVIFLRNILESVKEHHK